MTKRRLIFLLKLACTCLMLGIVVYQTDIGRIAGYLRDFPPGLLAAGAGALLLSQGVSALRLRYYLSTAGISYMRPAAVKLYFLGMFFNNLLPGGIGGDGYIVYLLKKEYQLPATQGIRLMLAARASGLLALCGFALVLLPSFIPAWVVPAAVVPLLLGYGLAARYILKEPPAVSLRAALYSLGVQSLSLVAAVLLLLGLPLAEGTLSDYLWLFLISSIMAVLPVSVGGVGLREFTFLYGAKLAGLNPETGVAFSVIYYAVNMLCSLPGAYGFYRVPNTAEITSSTRCEVK